MCLQLELQADQEVVVYDQSSSDPQTLSSESFLSVLLGKLERSFPSVHLLSGESGSTLSSHMIESVINTTNIINSRAQFVAEQK